VFDKYFLPVIKAPLVRLATPLIDRGISANQVTVAAFVVGMIGALFISMEMYGLGLVAICLNRLGDGLDGTIARITDTSSDAGGYLDIVLDFIFYSGVVVGFAVAVPEENALAAAFLIWSFMGTGSSFLAFAIMAAKQNIEQLEYGKKSLYFLGGITEGSETIACFVLMCLMPSHFVLLAVVFGCLCWVTTATRVFVSYKMLKA
jgi:phosphatidylglycerophosphate synthase